MSIRPIPSGSSSPHSATRMGRTPSVGCIARSTAGARSPRCCTRTSTRAPTKSGSIRAIRARYMPRSGSSNRHSTSTRRSAPTRRGRARAGSTSPPTAARPGRSSPADCHRCSRRISRSHRAIVMWRTEDGGSSWSAVRGSPGGDDYQRIWIHPEDPNLILAVSDQGAVISSNRGESWSNWYTQPTAAVYHVTADNAFPYRVCSGQQDSGSICVASRSDDGEITFHDWHPANIQEYGIGAPDPRDPDVVFGSARRGVSRYDRRTGQTTPVGPDVVQRGDS